MSDIYTQIWANITDVVRHINKLAVILRETAENIMEDIDIMLAGEKAKPLHKIKDNGVLKEQMEILKELLEKNGLNTGIIRIQIFAENKEQKSEELSSVEFTDKGCLLYYYKAF